MMQLRADEQRQPPSLAQNMRMNAKFAFIRQFRDSLPSWIGRGGR